MSMTTPRTRTARAASRSVVSLLDSLRKTAPGKMTHTLAPMVEPTKPSTSSMSGMRIPMVRQIRIRTTVLKYF